MPKDALDRHRQAIDWLRGIAEGRIQLPSATSVASNATRGTLGATTGEDRLLTRDEMSRH